MFSISSSKITIYYIIVFNVWTLSGGDVFTSMTHVESLFEVQKNVANDLDDYIIKEENRLNSLKRYYNLFREREKEMEDVSNYVGNPINMFTLIKRLTYDYSLIKKLVVGNQFNPLNSTNITYPTLEDVTGAAKALSRLQDFYLLKTEDLAEGRLNGVFYRDDGTSAFKYRKPSVSTITASDCYELSKTLYLLNETDKALAWMAQTLRKLKMEYQERSLDTSPIWFLGEESKSLDPTDPTYLDVNDWSTLPNSTEHQTMVKKDKEGKGHENVSTVNSFNEKYKAMCRGEMQISDKVKKKLRCRYLQENHPFLKIAPIKMEYLHHDPDIIMFHEVLSDGEIEQIKLIATPKISRARIFNVTLQKVETTEQRISKTTIIEDSEPLTSRMSRRVSDFSGLDLSHSESWSIINYGIGGNYWPHFDATPKETPYFDETTIGNRIATAIFYMSDVPLGGATVFLQLGLKVTPVRGAALFWYNLHPSCELDTHTLHSGCPVLVGNKWVATKWIYRIGQEFTKPCNQEYQDQNYRFKN